MKVRQDETIGSVFTNVNTDVPTNTRSSSVNLDLLRDYIKHNSEKLLIDQETLFKLLSGQATILLSPDTPLQRPGNEVFLNSTVTAPQLSLIGLNDFPIHIKEFLNQLRAGLEDEDALYEIAETIVDWLADESDEYQASLAIELQNMSSPARHKIVSVLADTETQINNHHLLETIGSFLLSTDKILAQSSAVCLLTCGGIVGKEVLQNQLRLDNIPHFQLIRGIIKLFN